jgi:hypothetical protein
MNRTLHEVLNEMARRMKSFYTAKKRETKTAWRLVRKRTIPPERPSLVDEVSANFCGWRVSRGQRNGFPRPLISVF